MAPRVAAVGKAKAVPAVGMPAATKPAIAKPAIAKPAVAKSAVAKSAAAKSAAAKAAVSNRIVAKKPLSKKVPPTLAIEKGMWADGHDVIVGIDEVGRGSWAGPLAIGAAVLPTNGTGRINGIRDSKMLTEREREALFDRVAGWCRAWAVGMVSHEECDTIGMSAAQKLATRRALEALGLVPDRVLIDGNWDFVGDAVAPGATTRIVRGDATCLSISAASVLAKVTRDRLMREEDEHFPAFNFADNKGYPCPRHKMALQAFGPTTIHRRSWVFMEHLQWGIERTTPPSWNQPSLFAPPETG